MPNSMTGFGRAEASGAGVAATVEIRSVNNRYLHVKTRLPSRYLRFESQVEEAVRGAMARGSVEVFVRVKALERRESPSIDAALAKAYVRSIRDLAAATELPSDIGLETVLSLPGVVTLEDREEVDEREWKHVRGAVKQAVADLVAARKAEGTRLAETLEGLLGDLEKTVGAVAARAPKIPVQLKKKLTKRIETLLGRESALEPGALEREVALAADRCDVTEEIDRLGSHIEGFRKTLRKRQPIGRALDFLVQEMGREANTVGSKNQDVVFGRLVIELKTTIEKLREQVQNLE